MTAKSLRHFAGASISADDLFERHKIACGLKQPVDHDKIKLEPGEYEFRIGREYDPYAEIARRQAD